MKKRQSSFELLRIIAMVMVITRHYLTKGGVIVELYEDFSAYNIAMYFFDAFCLVCCNVYVLISGYFMVDSTFKLRKIMDLILQVLFYSILTPLVLGALGTIDIASLTFGQIITIMLPIEQEHYWFATAYVGLFILSPLLSSAVNYVSKETLRYSIFGLYIMYGGFKSISPYKIPFDRYGEDTLWFICLFLTAAYIKKYGIALLNTKAKCLATYACASIASFAIALFCAIVAARTGKLEYYMDMVYCHNYITVFIASIGLFYAFTYIDMDIEWINRIGSCTFGIYLLHNHSLIDYEWTRWMSTNSAIHKWWQPLHWISCVLIIFLVGTLVDLIRQMIFRSFKSGIYERSSK